MKIGLLRSNEKLIPVLPARCGLLNLQAVADTLFPGFSFPVGISLINALAADEDRTLKTLGTAKESAICNDKSFVVSPDGLEWMPPIPDARQIIAAGLNYRSHCLEQHIPIPSEPRFFAKLASSMTGHLQPVSLWPISRKIDYEGELGVVIGRPAFQVPENRAIEMVAGFTIINDVTARDLQKNDHQWTRAKGLDGFCPIGPYMTTRDEISDPNNLRIITTVNGIIRQEDTTSDMIFSVSELISTISRAITLMPGDIISTGTPCGVGLFMEPASFLTDGDVVEICIEGLGTLCNRFVRA